MSAIARPENVQVQTPISIAEPLLEYSITGALKGVFASCMFSIVTPLGGAIFGATDELLDMAGNRALDTLSYKNRQNNFAKFIIAIAKVAISIISYIGASLVLFYSCGVALTLPEGMVFKVVTCIPIIPIVAAITFCRRAAAHISERM